MSSTKLTKKTAAATPARHVPASDAAHAEGLRRIEAEYRSAAITHHLVLWLIQVGASPCLVELGLRIVRDELAHARAEGDAEQPVAEWTLRGALRARWHSLGRFAGTPRHRPAGELCRGGEKGAGEA